MSIESIITAAYKAEDGIRANKPRRVDKILTNLAKYVKEITLWAVGAGVESLVQINTSAANTAPGDYAVATGLGSVAEGNNSFATGENAKAHGVSSFASGTATFATGDNSFVGGEGNGTLEALASGTGSFAFYKQEDTANQYGATGNNSAVLGGIDGEAAGLNSAVIGGEDLNNTQDNTVMVPAIVCGLVTTPGTPQDGTIYFDGTNFQGWNGTAWVQLDN